MQSYVVEILKEGEEIFAFTIGDAMEAQQKYLNIVQLYLQKKEAVTVQLKHHGEVVNQHVLGID